MANSIKTYYIEPGEVIPITLDYDANIQGINKLKVSFSESLLLNDGFELINFQSLYCPKGTIYIHNPNTYRGWLALTCVDVVQKTDEVLPVESIEIIQPQFMVLGTKNNNPFRLNILPTNASLYSVAFTSSDESVLKFNSADSYDIVGMGVVDITVTVTNNDGSIVTSSKQFTIDESNVLMFEPIGLDTLAERIVKVSNTSFYDMNVSPKGTNNYQAIYDKSILDVSVNESKLTIKVLNTATIDSFTTLRLISTYMGVASVKDYNLHIAPSTGFVNVTSIDNVIYPMTNIIGRKNNVPPVPMVVPSDASGFVVDFLPVQPGDSNYAVYSRTTLNVRPSGIWDSLSETNISAQSNGIVCRITNADGSGFKVVLSMNSRQWKYANPNGLTYTGKIGWNYFPFEYINKGLYAQSYDGIQNITLKISNVEWTPVNEGATTPRILDKVSINSPSNSSLISTTGTCFSIYSAEKGTLKFTMEAFYDGFPAIDDGKTYSITF
ncbi:hypothetical protein I4544_09050 [Klebsiella michiganensis]|uniref:hypothetical protein n=1 Tax=Klebsiella michiganensis TaxID=1134687 RepID=UPI0018C778A4|nr:hypothetical protein [Klebsiella michiganensis]MBG2586392.1 hypothetical protein [Klebsiella michiganensis]